MNYHNEKLEEFEATIGGKRVAIIGLGVSNLPLLDYLYRLHCEVAIFDKKEEDTFHEQCLNKIKEYQFKLYTGSSALENLKNFDYIFRSPSCRPDRPEIISEIAGGAVLTSEIELVMKLCPCPIIAITGSDGKTTTTNLIYQIIKEKGYHCYLGGNIGFPLFTQIREMKPQDIVILELSSFQLMEMPVSPHIAVITNIAPNHLDIHASYEEYIECKKNIFKFQNENDIVVLNYDNEITKKCANEANAKVKFFSSKEKLADGFIYDKGIIKSCEDGVRRHLVTTKEIPLRGIHNYENICAALAATSSLVDANTQIEAIKKFTGVEHRLEFVREINGVKWYNDSIGTSPSRTIAGLNAFEEKIVLIAGGYDKHLDYHPIAKPIVDNVSILILMGATAPKIKEAVEEELRMEGKQIPIYECTTLEESVQRAYQVARNGEVVLFSPASASFDLFKNFEERGNKFKEIVNTIKDIN